MNIKDKLLKDTKFYRTGTKQAFLSLIFIKQPDVSALKAQAYGIDNVRQAIRTLMPVSSSLLRSSSGIPLSVTTV
jgi:hypothetical protein